MITIISPLKVNSGIVSLDEMLRRKQALDESGRVTAVSPAQDAVPENAFSIIEYPGVFHLRNVPHCGALYDMVWRDQLLRDDVGDVAMHGQMDWCRSPEYRRIGRSLYHLPTGPEYASTFIALYHARDMQDEMQRESVHACMNTLHRNLLSWPVMTSTRVTYRKNDTDSACHGPLQDAGYTISGVLKGFGRYINAGCADCMDVLLGVRDVDEFRAAILWMTEGIEPAIHTRTDIADADEVSPLCFHVTAGEFSINVCDPPNLRMPAIGIRVARVSGGAP